MKKVVKLSAVFLLVLMLALSCASCQLRTRLNIDNNFKGVRYLELSVNGAESKLLTDATGIEDINSFEERVKAECPENMSLQSVVKNGSGGYTVTFMIEFNSFDDYKSKIASILDREPKIDFKETKNLFFPGYSLKEDFSSADLLAWAIDKLSENGINDVKVSDIISSATEVKLNQVVKSTNYPDKSRIDVDIVGQWEIKHISMTTKFLGNGSVSRQISFCIPQTTIDKLSADKIDEYFKSIAPVGSECTWERGANERFYIIDFSALISDLGSKTASVLGVPVRAIKYTTDSQAQNGFTFSNDYEETLDFSAWPINSNRTCPVKIKYKTIDGSSLSAVEGWKLSGDMTTLDYESAGVDVLSVKFKNAATYTPSDIAIEMTQLDSRIFTRTITFTFNETASDNGANRLKEYLLPYLDDKMTAEVKKAANGNSQLVIKGEGTLKELSVMFSNLLGGDNTIKATEKRSLLVKKQINIEDLNSFVVMLRASGFTGNISYNFTSAKMSKAKNTVITDVSGNILERLVPDKNTHKTSYKTNLQEFKATYTVETYDFIILAIVGGGLLLFIVLISAISSSIKKKKIRQRILTKEEVKQEQEKAVKRKMMGANIENNISETNDKNTIVVEPDYDDGLSRPDDESEGSWLLVNTIRILAVVASVLFFLPFANISINRAIIDKSAWLTGLKMFIGGDIPLDMFGLTGKVSYAGNIKSIILILIPIVILLILSIRKWVKPTVAYIFTAVLSVAQIIYLVSLPSYIDNLVGSMKSGNGITSVSHDLGFAYTWSVIVYIVIAAVLLFVIFAEFGRLNRIAKTRDEDVYDEMEESPVFALTDGSTDNDDAVNEAVENVIGEPEISEAIELPSASEEVDEQIPFDVTPEEVEEISTAVEEDERVVEKIEEIPQVSEVEEPASIPVTVTPKKITAHVKPKRRNVVLPSQEEFDEHSGY